jgi:hypothetical protein
LAFYFLVMPGLVPGIHVSTGVAAREDVDGRDKPGHDELSTLYLLHRHCGRGEAIHGSA